MYGVGILKLVDMNLLETLLVKLQHIGVIAQQFVRPQQQFGKIDQSGAVAQLFIGFIYSQHLPLIKIAGLQHMPGPNALVFLRVDIPLRLARRPLVGIEIKRSQQALDKPQLVGGIHHLKGFRQFGLFGMAS